MGPVHKCFDVQPSKMELVLVLSAYLWLEFVCNWNHNGIENKFQFRICRLFRNRNINIMPKTSSAATLKIIQFYRGFEIITVPFQYHLMGCLYFLYELRYEERLGQNKKYFESQKLEILILKVSELLSLDAYLFLSVILTSFTLQFIGSWPVSDEITNWWITNWYKN